jgi:hypothetical protein
MFREVMIKLGGVTLLLLGIGFFTFGLVLASKFMQATGFMSGIVSLVLLYYTWVTTNSRPMEEEPPEIRPVAK